MRGAEGACSSRGLWLRAAPACDSWARWGQSHPPRDPRGWVLVAAEFCSPVTVFLSLFHCLGHRPHAHADHEGTPGSVPAIRQCLGGLFSPSVPSLRVARLLPAQSVWLSRVRAPGKLHLEEISWISEGNGRGSCVTYRMRDKALGDQVLVCAGHSCL